MIVLGKAAEMDDTPFESDGSDILGWRRGLEIGMRLLEPHISQQRHRRCAAEAAEASNNVRALTPQASVRWPTVIGRSGCERIKSSARMT